MSDQTDEPDGGPESTVPDDAGTGPTEPDGGPESTEPEAAATDDAGTGPTEPDAAASDGDAAGDGAPDQLAAPPVAGAVPVTPPPDTSAAAAATGAAAATAWPTSAKVWVGVLAVIALLLGIATIVGFNEASSSDDDTAAVQEELAAAENRADSAEQERDEVAAELQAAEAENETLTSELATRNAELADAQAENEVLAAAVETERSRADAAEAELAEIQAQLDAVFPITVDTSLVGLDLAGSYTISFEEKYCDFATGCGTTPDANQAIIGVTPENFLDITIPGILQGGLFAVNGGLYAITDSETAIPPCGDVPRRGRVTITIWPSSIEVGEDGVAFPTALEASITLDAPTINECPSGLVFWGAKLTPNT